jgi:hypothetical protein
LSSRRGPQWRYDPIVLKRLLAGWRRPADDLPPLHPRLESYRAEVDRFDGYIHDTPIRQLAGGRAILALPREEQVVILLQSFAVMRLLSKESRWRFRFRVLDDGLMAVSRKRGGLRILAMALLRRRLPFSEAQILQLADEACGEHIDSFYNLPLGGLVRAFESYAREAPLPEEIRPLLAEFVRRLRDRGGLAEWRRLAGRLEALLAEDGGDAPAVPLGRGDAWADRLLDGIEELPAGEQAAWRDLLAHARTAGTAMPARAWSERAQTLLESDVQRAFPALLRDVLDALGQPGSGPSRTEDPRLLDDRYTDLLRGLVWCVGLHGDEARVGQLVGAAGRCFKKVRSAGPLNVKVGNACLWALGAVPGPAAVAALGTLRGRVRHASTRAQIDKALAAAAKRLGMDEKEVAEAAVPDFGMVEVGCLRRAVGEFEAVLRLTHSTRVETRWLKPDGREQKTAPKPVREAYPDEVDAVRSLVREIKAVLPGQRDRLERLLLERREWPRELWRERYLDHPLVGSLVRRLIWTFRREDGEATAIWHDGALTRLDGTPLGGAYDNARVSLWHPLEAGEETIRGWRLWLYDHQTTQPFKQAHREIYLLTDAERDTVTYSNRFAAHILKQHQFAALCQQRGWRYTLQGAWDSHNTPSRTLEEHDLLVEFWVDPAPAETSEMGVYLYLASDQVRFCDLAGDPRPLEQVPPLVFSEMMRDVDLFVGVASVGNDPLWQDHGEERFNAYWQQYSFGDLGEAARTRKEALESIVPRLAIADRCSFSDRFLVVRGKLATYKIHCGSGNVLLEGSGRYLCIVPGRWSRGKAARPFLPFEGDGVLAIVLSKAFLLAADDRIEDPSILGQIRR